MPFHYKIIEVKTDRSSMKEFVDKAYKILNGKLPESNKNCGYCKWNQEIIKFLIEYLVLIHAMFESDVKKILI